MAVAIWRAPARFAVPLALVLGGAAGNLIDRLRFGYVIDYVGVGPLRPQHHVHVWGQVPVTGRAQTASTSFTRRTAPEASSA